MPPQPTTTNSGLASMGDAPTTQQTCRPDRPRWTGGAGFRRVERSRAALRADLRPMACFDCSGQEIPPETRWRAVRSPDPRTHRRGSSFRGRRLGRRQENRRPHNDSRSGLDSLGDGGGSTPGRSKWTTGLPSSRCASSGMAAGPAAVPSTCRRAGRALEGFRAKDPHEGWASSYTSPDRFRPSGPGSPVRLLLAPAPQTAALTRYRSSFISIDRQVCPNSQLAAGEEAT